MVWVGVLSFAYHMNQLNARQYDLCPPERFESRHQFYPPFDIPVILLDQIVQILILPDHNGFFFWFIRTEHHQSGGVCAAFIDGDDFRFAVMPDGLTKEAQCSSGIPSGGQQEVDGLTRRIHRLVQVFPLALTLMYVSSIRQRRPT